ncbi:MAG: substrate-binding domain-containing protein [Luteolibacter sp.]
METKHQLIENGHSAFYTDYCLNDFNMDVRRIARMVRKTQVDAWVVVGGSQEILEWFAQQPVPSFAFFGRRRNLRMAGAGPDKPPAYASATRTLLALGHRRIVLLSHAVRRLPKPGASELAFLEELAAAGIKPGEYHMPDWGETIEGLHARLESLFHLTPPTAMIVDTIPLYCAVEEFFARRGLRVPEDVSLVCADTPDMFVLRRTPVSHIRWDSRKVVRRVISWAGNISRGRQDFLQTLAKAEFVPGGTICKAKKI